MHSYILSNFSITTAIRKICEVAKLDVSFENFNQHPDIYHINPQVNEKTVLQKPSIKIGQIRQFQQEFNKKPLILPVQIAVIWQAQFLTLSASNALLKILEEPVKQSLIFLSIDNYQHLLSTIQSRCEIINAQAEDKSQPAILETPIDLKSLYQTDMAYRMDIITKSCPTQQEALQWLQSLMQTAQSKLAKSTPKGMQSLGILLENCQTIYNDISIYNVNYKLALDMLAIKWDKPINIYDD